MTGATATAATEMPTAASAVATAAARAMATVAAAMAAAAAAATAVAGTDRAELAAAMAAWDHKPRRQTLLLMASLCTIVRPRSTLRNCRCCVLCTH